MSALDDYRAALVAANPEPQNCGGYDDGHLETRYAAWLSTVVQRRPLAVNETAYEAWTRRQRELHATRQGPHVCWFGCFEKWHINESDFRAGKYEWKENA